MKTPVAFVLQLKVVMCQFEPAKRTNQRPEQFNRSDFKYKVLNSSSLTIERQFGSTVHVLKRPHILMRLHTQSYTQPVLTVLDRNLAKNYPSVLTPAI